MSETRKHYMLKLVGRCMVFALCAIACIRSPEIFGVLEGWNFFREFSWLHVLWLLWMADMLPQLIPYPNHVPLGSTKLFARRFRPGKITPDPEALRSFIRKENRGAALVFAVWCALLAVIGLCWHRGLFGKPVLFLICVFFYVCDLICVLIWCPFRLMMGNRCCTTCRIFNWDHLMMFSPLFFLGGFYGLSLAATATLAFLLWEWMLLRHPERFWERTNAALRCASCTDKLCTQYCPKRTEK